LLEVDVLISPSLRLVVPISSTRQRGTLGPLFVVFARTLLNILTEVVTINTSVKHLPVKEEHPLDVRLVLSLPEEQVESVEERKTSREQTIRLLVILDFNNNINLFLLLLQC
jgi:hypothetical protein